MTLAEILVVLPHASSRQSWEETVQGLECTVRYVEKEQEALRLLSHGEIDVVVVDGRGVSGAVSVAEAITRLRPHQAILLVSSVRVPSTLGAANPYLISLAEPVLPATVRREVERLVEARRLLRENSQLIAENYRQMRQLDLVGRIHEIVLRADRDQAVATLVDLVMAETGASRGALVCPREGSDGVRVLCQRGFPDGAGPERNLRWGQGYLGAALARGTPSLLETGEAPQGVTEEEIQVMGSSCLVLPLTIRGQVAGGMILCGHKEGGSFSPYDLHLAQCGVLPLASLLEQGEAAPPSPAEEPSPSEEEGFRDQGSLEELLTYEVLKGSRHRRPFTLLLVDFGTLRDQGTEPSGMPLPVAREVRRALGRVLRATDVVARLEGGEVALFAPETDYHGAITVARRIRQLFRRTLVEDGPATHVVSLLGCGIACYPDHATSVSGLIARARESLAHSKTDRYLHDTLWEFVASLLDEAERFAEVERILSRESRRVTLVHGDASDHSPGVVVFIKDPEEFTLMMRFIEQEARRGVLGEGVVYLGVGLFSNVRPYLDTYYAMREQGIGVYLFGKDDWMGWESQGLIAVPADDPEMVRHRFIFYYGVTTCYGLIGHRENGEKFRGVFTTRPSLINEFMKKIKQLYPVKEWVRGTTEEE